MDGYDSWQEHGIYWWEVNMCDDFQLGNSIFSFPIRLCNYRSHSESENFSMIISKLNMWSLRCFKEATIKSKGKNLKSRTQKF